MASIWFHLVSRMVKLIKEIKRIRRVSEGIRMYIPAASMGEYDSYKAPAPRKKPPGTLERTDSRRTVERSDSRGALGRQSSKGEMVRSSSRSQLNRFSPNKKIKMKNKRVE